MHWIDWLIVGAYLLVVTGIGLAFISKASGSVADYFVAGRQLPWWLAGTSLVATSFAADTPLFVAGVIATKGVAGNWVWWNQAIAWALAITVFARMWRRSGVVTDAELIELRYSGRSAAFLRGFRGFYMSFIISTATLAWVMLAMQMIVAATIPEPAWVGHGEAALAGALGCSPDDVDLWKPLVLCVLFLVTTVYTVLSGMWGIVVTDLFQFAIAMGGSLLFAVYAADSVGGIQGLKDALTEEFGAARAAEALEFFPGAGSTWMPISAFTIYMTVVWWGDCNGFAAQRLLSTRTEKDSVLAALWYSVAHFALRPWPWVVVGLVAMVHYPGIADPESGYPRLMMEILPTGMRGLMVASLLAAFMSTVDTHLNWNASYLVNDIYRRFIAPEASEARCVFVSRLAVIGFAALAIAAACVMPSIESGVLLFFNLQAGVGLVMMLRWFWWRVNAWSEISAMVASMVITTALPFLDHHFGWGLTAWWRIAITALLTPAIWLAVTFVTRPTDRDRLRAFYRQVRPPSLGWRPIAQLDPASQGDEPSVLRLVAVWMVLTIALFATTFAVGHLVLLQIDHGLVCVVLAGIAWAYYYRYAFNTHSDAS